MRVIKVDGRNRPTSDISHHVNLFSCNAFRFSLMRCSLAANWRSSYWRTYTTRHFSYAYYVINIKLDQVVLVASKAYYSMMKNFAILPVRVCCCCCCDFVFVWFYFEYIFTIIIIVLSWLRSVERHIDAFNIRSDVSTLSMLPLLLRSCQSFWKPL